MNTQIFKIALIFALTILPTACGAKKSLIFVVDFSDSVSGAARSQTFAAIREQAKLLGRGDSITVIPVTGDAQTETGGKVVRLEAGEIRKLRDKDLKEFQAAIETKLGAMIADAKIYKQTDLLGAMRIAQEESALQKRRGSRVLIFVLSDLVHSTAPTRFESDAAFVNADNARKFAEKICAGRSGEFGGAEIYLGLLESSDLRKMTQQRREALREFWQEYFKIGGAKRLQFATDGAGQMDGFLRYEG